MKSQRVYRFLVVLLLTFPATIFSQQQLPRIGQNSPHILSIAESFYGNGSLGNGSNRPGSSVFLASAANARPVAPLRISHIATQPPMTCILDESLPFFCKKEVQFEKATSIPLRLRLGSLEYVNKLEGKK